MDGNPEGTPNPLNPVQGVSKPEPSTDAATGAGTLENHDSGSTTTSNFGSVKPASFAEPTVRPAGMSEPAQKSSMPRMQTAASRPVRPSHNVVDPMMRPVSHSTAEPASAETPAMSRTENNFDTFSMEELSEVDVEPSNAQITEVDTLVARDSVVEPKSGKGKKKKIFIICTIILAIVAIICGAAAIAIVVVSNNNRVGMAIDKLLSGQTSSIIAGKGTINTTSASTNSSSDNDTSTTAISFDGAVDTISGISKLEASVIANSGSTTTAELEINEVSNKNGDTYFKISGLSSILKNFITPTLQTGEVSTTNTTNCAEASDGTNCNVAATDASSSAASGLTTLYNNLMSKVEDQWLLITDDMSETVDDLGFFDNASLCMVNALSSLSKYGTDLASKYRANPFITSSKDNLGIAQKSNELYRLGFDKEKLNAFMNSVGSNGFVTAFNECAGSGTTDSKDSSSLFEEIFANLPTMYVEVDNDNNFTRLYFASTIEVNGISTSTKADINISYPASLKVALPDDYQNASTVFTILFANQSI